MVKEAAVPAGVIPCEAWTTGSEGEGKALWEAEPAVSPRRHRLEKNGLVQSKGCCSRKNGQVPRTKRRAFPVNSDVSALVRNPTPDLSLWLPRLIKVINHPCHDSPCQKGNRDNKTRGLENWKS